MVPDEVRALFDIVTREAVCHSIKSGAGLEGIITALTGRDAIADAGAPEVLEGSRRIGIEADRIHSKDVELLDDQMVKISISGLSRDFLGDADPEHGVECLLLADPSCSIGGEVAILEEGAHHGARNPTPVSVEFHRM